MDNKVIPVLIACNVVAMCELFTEHAGHAMVRENYGQGRRYFRVIPVQSNFAQWKFLKEDALDILREILQA